MTEPTRSVGRPPVTVPVPTQKDLDPMTAPETSSSLDLPEPPAHEVPPASGEDAVQWHLRLHPRPLKIARLDPASAVPEWARRPSPLSSVTWNEHETSVIAPADVIPLGVDQAGPFQAFEVEGPLDFTLTGVLGGLLRPLARAQVSVITMSTFETDWVLVPVDQVETAARALRESGHTVTGLLNDDEESS